MLKTILQKDDQIHQGDIFRNIDCIESAEEVNGEILIQKVTYPYVMVMTQECDLQADYTSYKEQSPDERPIKANHLIDNALVVPLYNFEHFRYGLHLSNLDYLMSDQYNPKGSSTAIKALIDNEVPRYHYLKFPPDVAIVDSVADFKHYFTISLRNLYKQFVENEKRVCSLEIPFRERITQRFADYFSRIGLPK